MKTSEKQVQMSVIESFGSVQRKSIETQCKSSAEKPGPKVEKPGSRRSEVSEFLEPTSHSEVYFHGPGLVRPHDLEFYRC